MISNVSTNVFFQQHKVTRDERAAILGHHKGYRGCTIWFTGLSGAGKTTISFGLEKMLTSVRISHYSIAKVAAKMTNNCIISVFSWAFRATASTATTSDTAYARISALVRKTVVRTSGGWLRCQSCLLTWVSFRWHRSSHPTRPTEKKRASFMRRPELNFSRCSLARRSIFVKPETQSVSLAYVCSEGLSTFEN